jgi:hypothetical protein
MQEDNGKGLNLAERRVLVKSFFRRYQRGSKKDKSAILDEFAEMTGYHRTYAAWLLRQQGRQIRVGANVRLVADVGLKKRRRRKRHYGKEVERVVVQLWEMLDYLCGKRLVAALPQLIGRLEACGELQLPQEVRQKVLQVSASTIDRMLASHRKKYQLKGRSGTRPGTLLKYQIPIKRFSDWEDSRAGFVEVDLVGHEGGNSRGDFMQTLDLTDVATGWTECRAVKNKARVWVVEALDNIRRKMPFPLLGLSSDNGAEFINAHLLEYCVQHRISFCRTRPNRKNDNCYIEQKNYSVVRQAVGYFRYDRAEQLELLNEVYDALRLLNNFFKPVMKMQSKQRTGSRITKRYDAARTAYQRVLESDELSQKAAARLRRQFEQLNPAELSRRIRRLREQLWSTCHRSALG